jgi:haloacetate dehalogenase
MLDDFETREIDTGETAIFTRHAGVGHPILLLHGFLQTHLMWRDVAPLVARQFSVICADLREYGRSCCPISDPGHVAYAKRAMARDMVIAMQRLGYSRFSVAGHDRGGRVAYWMALDYPDHIIPTASSGGRFGGKRVSDAAQLSASYRRNRTFG